MLFLWLVWFVGLSKYNIFNLLNLLPATQSEGSYSCYFSVSVVHLLSWLHGLFCFLKKEETWSVVLNNLNHETQYGEVIEAAHACFSITGHKFHLRFSVYKLYWINAACGRHHQEIGGTKAMTPSISLVSARLEISISPVCLFLMLEQGNKVKLCVPVPFTLCTGFSDLLPMILNSN